MNKRRTYSPCSLSQTLNDVWIFHGNPVGDDLPEVIGKISDSWDDPGDGKVWDHGELVQYAQEKFARSDSNAAIVRNTRYYKYSDPWHYDSKGYLDLGEKFAESLFNLDTQK